MNENQKRMFASFDYNIGREFALKYYLKHLDELKQSKKAKELALQLQAYKDFGEGDQTEEELWEAIITELYGTCENYWHYWQLAMDEEVNNNERY